MAYRIAHVLHEPATAANTGGNGLGRAPLDTAKRGRQSATGIHLLARRAPGVFVARAAGAKLAVLLVEMHRELFGDLRFPFRGQCEVGESTANLRGPVRHNALR